MKLQHALMGGSKESSSGEKDSQVITDPADTNGDGQVSLAELLAYQFKQMELYQQSNLTQNVSPLMDVIS